MNMTWDNAHRIMKDAGVEDRLFRCISIGARRLLFEACRDSENVLELGTYTGISALALALGAKGRVVTVDKEDVNADDAFWSRSGEGSAGRPCELMKRAGVSVRFVHSDSVAYMEELTPDCLDVVFIDSGHDVEKHPQGHVTLKELRLARRALRPGGCIILDDVFPHDIPIVAGGFHVPGPWLALEDAKKEGLIDDYDLIQALPDGSQTRMAIVRL